MIHPFLIAALLTMLSPQNQKLPDEFYRLPEQIRESATVIVSGTFGCGRTPCMIRADGLRVWGIESFINIKTVYRGGVKCRSIDIDPRKLPATSHISQELKQGQKYLVLLRPGSETMKKLQTTAGNGFWDALHDEEIVAIVETK